MLDLFKDLIDKQYQASLCMLNRCIDRCSDDAWNQPVANLAFCQAAFHCLIFTDLYLGPRSRLAATAGLSCREPTRLSRL